MSYAQTTRPQAAVPSEPATESPHPQAVVLWPNGAPGSEARKGEPEKLDWRAEPENNITFPVLFNIHNPSIIPFIPEKSKATGAAVVVAPGGGHMFVTIDREGYDVGKWFADHGVAAFVLKYRLARDRGAAAGQSPYKVDVDALADAKRAMRVIRSRASEWGIDANRVGFMGFSAGGELSGLLATRYDKGDPNAADPVEKLSCQPNFNGFIYGGPYRVETFDPAAMAPSWLMCAYDDTGNARNQANLFLKLQNLKIPAELHIYGAGGHGFGVRQDRGFAQETWPARFVDWMKDINMLTPKKS
jgi:endo-1,4-beta-xylanase